MSRILFAWELGANYGHLSRLVPLAIRLREQGHTILFAIRNLRYATEFLDKQEFDFIGAPLPPVAIRPDPNFMPASYADILALQGMHDIAMLAPQVAAWHTIFGLFKPDVIVLDHAPVAMTSAKLAGLPRIAIGTGFELPPLGEFFPPFRKISAARYNALQQTEQRIVQTLNGLFEKYGCIPPKKGSDIFQGTSRFFSTLPELDHYGQREEANYIGIMPNFRGNSQAKTVTWPVGKKKILAYLQPVYPALKDILHAFGESGHVVISCIPGAAQPVWDIGTSHLNVVTSLINTAPLIPQADLVITHGGHGMVGEALLAGKPQLILPQQLEQSLLGQKIEALGIGQALSPQHTQSKFVAAIVTLIEESRYREAAGKIQEKYAVGEPDAALVGLVKAIEGVAAGLE